MLQSKEQIINVFFIVAFEMFMVFISFEDVVASVLCNLNAVTMSLNVTKTAAKHAQNVCVTEKQWSSVYNINIFLLNSMYFYATPVSLTENRFQ